MIIDAATRIDLPQVRDLLERQHLPLDGVDDLPDTMVVARHDGRIVGAAALELYADGALLRSVVVDPAVQGQRVGHQLTESALTFARDRGIGNVYLLTTTAEHFFPRFGFERIDRNSVPASVQSSVEFRSACPASAVVMRRRLSATA